MVAGVVVGGVTAVSNGFGVCDAAVVRSKFCFST
jgi:hypothetical protein